MEDRIRFRLLGPLGVTVDGVPARLPGTAERALLVLLLLSEGQLVTATSRSSHGPSTWSTTR